MNIEPNVHFARNKIIREFAAFSEKIQSQEREDFFDPRNRDTWLAEFTNFLKARINPDLRSND